MAAFKELFIPSDTLVVMMTEKHQLLLVRKKDIRMFLKYPVEPGSPGTIGSDT